MTGGYPGGWDSIVPIVLTARHARALEAQAGAHGMSLVEYLHLIVVRAIQAHAPVDPARNTPL